MALYWRSPYNKEIRNSSSTCDVKASPRSSHSAKSTITRFSEPVSPQDWFDASLAAMKSPPSANFRRRAGSFIKGILKEPQVNASDLSEEEEVRQLDSGDENARAKKTKKKVTFGLHNQESADRSHDFQASRSTLAHQIRLQNREPLDEFARQNLRKLLGYSQVPKPSLPTLAGKALLPSTDTGTSPTSAGSHSQKSHLTNGEEDHSSLKTPRIHEPTLSTPNYLDFSRHVNKTGLDLSVEGVVATPDIDHVHGDGDKDSNEPVKQLKRHWTKSFLTKPTDKKKIYRKLAGRYPFSAGTLHRSILFKNTSQEKTSTSDDMTSDFLKLHITGEGTMHGATSASADPEHPRGAWTHQTQTSARSDGHNFRGIKIPSTLTSLPDGYAALARQRYGSSANQVHVRYGSQRLEGRDGSFSEHHLDKTAQILSWLQDVKQKDGFQPRNARLYAVEVQQQH